MIHAITSVIKLRSAFCLRPVAPTIGETHNLHSRFTRTYSHLHFHTMGTRTGTFCKEDSDSEEVAALFDAFRMLVTDWPGKISGISYKSGPCDDCDMFQIFRSILFCDWLAGCQW